MALRSRLGHTYCINHDIFSIYLGPAFASGPGQVPNIQAINHRPAASSRHCVVSHRLLVTVQIMTAEQSWEHFSKLLKALLMTCQLISVRHWPQLREFLLAVAKEKPGPVARSAMHMAVSGDLS